MSRYDLQGFFWEDEEHVGKDGTSRPVVLPSIPSSAWKTPAVFPNLSAAKIIGLDTETYDPNLKTHGPGWAREDGHIIGVSLSADDRSWYFPIRHELQKDMNMEPEKVFRFLNDVLGDTRPKVGANLQYDVGWLRQEGVHVKGMLYDVQYAEALIDDVARDYSLEAIAQKYLGIGKISVELYRWLSRAYGGPETGIQRRNMYRSPITLVGPYAEADAQEPLLILMEQFKVLHELGLWELFELECRLIPLLIDMRFRGIPVDLARADSVRETLLNKEKYAQEVLDKEAGFNVNVYSNDDLKQLFDNKAITYPYTEKGNPSFTKTWLGANKSHTATLVNDIRTLTKSRVTFIENGIIEKNVNGVVHPSFHPLRGEEGGAVSGRFSSSNPNAQQIPNRNKVLAPLIRGMYIPEKGYGSWLKLDLSQIEYRLFADVSEDVNLIADYQHRDTDYHEVVNQMLGGVMPRTVVKGFNFMSIYGGGKAKTISMVKDNMKQKDIVLLCNELGIKPTPHALGSHFVTLYAQKFPAAKKTIARVGNIAQQTGEIRTILNRRNTFNLWEPAGKYGKLPLTYDKAYERYGPKLQRALTYKALNRKLQGSAADLLKKGMVEAYENGLFNTIGVPHVTVHDELDFSFHKDLTKDAIEIKACIENTIKLKVPVIMDAEVGPDWGHVKETKLKC